MTVSEAQKRATRKYEATHYDRINVRLPKGIKERIKATGESVNGFMISATLKQLELYEKGEAK